MAEPTTALGLADFRKEAALALGYDRTYANLGTNQADDVDRIVEAAYRQFLWPPPVPDSTGRPYTHRWTFLRIIYGTMALAADDYDEDLPDNFGHVIGETVTIDDDAQGYPPIRRIGEQRIREWRQQDSTTTAVPKFFAVRPKAFTGAAGNRFEMVFYPTPDGVYDVTFAYSPLPDTMVINTYPYPWGGAAHAETVKASIWAMAEWEHDKERGSRYAYWMERLQASIEYDLAQEPANLGLNTERTESETRSIPDYTYAITYTPS